MKKIEEFSLEALRIGVTPSGKKKWIETKVVIKYDNNTNDMKEFESEKEALSYLMNKWNIYNAKQGVLDL